LDEGRARELLRAEHARVAKLLGAEVNAGVEDREAANEQDDWKAAASGMTEEQVDDALAVELRDHLERIERAEQRLNDGVYGRSIISGRPIPDERLEADPAVETLAEEAVQEE
jgi:DnaK suppressor protein